MQLTRSNLIFRLVCDVFFAIVIFCALRYLHYISAVVVFPYDWEATDGDHLNFAHRIAQGLPIYLTMGAGQALSIYNPLYHALVALIGGADAGMGFARGVSLLFWLLCPLTVLLYFFKKWGYFYSAIAAIFILLPSEPLMLLDIVQVSPNSSMAFLFLGTLLLAEHCTESGGVLWSKWILLGVVAALCFLAKQQGIIAIGSVMTFLVIRRVSIKTIAMVLLGFFSVFAVSYAYLEWVNSGEYLQATIFDLRKIMPHNEMLAKSRLYAFTIENNAAFIICVFVSLVAAVFRITKLSIWQVSSVLHLFFLLMILGNGGGGPNYFLTFWISMVLTSVEMISRLEKYSIAIPNPYFRITENGQSYFSSLAKVLLIGLFINISIGTISINRQISNSIYPTAELENLMKDYYQAVGTLVATKPNAKVLTNRNVGALVANNVNIENEGSTMFQYAWRHGDVFQPSVVLATISEKKYDFIVTGVQDYPVNIRAEINTNYKVALVKEEILNLGNVGLSTIYVPK